MKLLSLTSLILLLLATPNINTYDFAHPNQDTYKELGSKYSYVDTLITAFLDKTGVAGVSVSLSKAGEIIYSQGFGYADMERKIKMQASTQVRTASVAKVITATALGKLATEAKLDFDAPIKEYIPYVREPYASLSTRQIAGHTAGIQHRPSSAKDEKRHYDEIRPTVEFFQQDPLLFEPDTEYKYSSMGYNLLAALIEEVSGKRYVDYMQENIFAPLDMKQTFPDKVGEFSKMDAKMYYINNGKLKLDKKINDGSYKLAGAGFRSTSQDLLKMMNAYTNGFISAEIVQSMFSSNTLKNGKSTNVGIGWRLNKDISKRSTIEHAGNWQGARTVIVYYPESQLSISMMINTKCTVFIEETAHLLAQLFLEEPGKDGNLSGLNSALEIQNNLSDGSTENYKGRLSFSNKKIGQLSIETDRDWLKQNEVYNLSSAHYYALSTRYGLLFLNLDKSQNLEGKLYQYQVLGDKYHMDQKPFLILREEN